MTTQQTTDLIALAETLIATEQFAGSWAWHADPDGEGAYLDCSEPMGSRDTYTLEAGDGDDAVQLELTLSDLREIHRQLTVQLMVARLRGEG